MAKKFVIPKSKHTAINKFLAKAENVLLRRVYAINAGGSYSADDCMNYLMDSIERLGKLKDRGNGFEDDRQAAISLIWDMVAEIQKQPTHSPYWGDMKFPLFIEDHPIMKQAIGVDLHKTSHEERDGAPPWETGDWDKGKWGELLPVNPYAVEVEDEK